MDAWDGRGTRPTVYSLCRPIARPLQAERRALAALATGLTDLHLSVHEDRLIRTGGQRGTRKPQEEQERHQCESHAYS